MIQRQTVLVLGAGASAPYGFPLGSELVELIYNEFSKRKQNDLHHYMAELGYDWPELVEFAKALRDSGHSSIDTFLSHRTEYRELGKAAIAAILIPFESSDSVMSFRPKDGEDGWYRYLWNRLQAKWDDLQQNKLSIITFNYDRSLEHFLYTALRNTYAKPRGQILEQIQKLGIIHLHGTLGGMPYDSSPHERAFQPTLSAPIIRNAANSISIIHDELDSKVFAEAHSLMSKAEDICFLGFGFHPLNIERLKLKELPKDIRFRPTTYGLTQAEIMALNRAVGRSMADGGRVKILPFLRESGVMLE